MISQQNTSDTTISSVQNEISTTDIEAQSTKCAKIPAKLSKIKWSSVGFIIGLVIGSGISLPSVILAKNKAERDAGTGIILAVSITSSTIGGLAYKAIKSFCLKQIDDIKSFLCLKSSSSTMQEQEQVVLSMINNNFNPDVIDNTSDRKSSTTSDDVIDAIVHKVADTDMIDKSDRKSSTTSDNVIDAIVHKVADTDMIDKSDRKSSTTSDNVIDAIVHKVADTDMIDKSDRKSSTTSDDVIDVIVHKAADTDMIEGNSAD